VKRHLSRAGIAILDAPPGTACPMLETVRGADFVVLVAEPTVFGLHDLTLAVDAIRKVGVPYGVALNRVGPGGDGVERYCAQANIPVLLRIPEDRRIARSIPRRFGRAASRDSRSLDDRSFRSARGAVRSEGAGRPQRPAGHPG
jgi:MinD superfamily P-loop ATPase